MILLGHSFPRLYLHKSSGVGTPLCHSVPLAPYNVTTSINHVHLRKASYYITLGAGVQVEGQRATKSRVWGPPLEHGVTDLAPHGLRAVAADHEQGVSG